MTSLLVDSSIDSRHCIVFNGDRDAKIKLWDVVKGQCLRTLHPPRIYKQVDITGITGFTDAQKDTLKILGAVENN